MTGKKTAQNRKLSAVTRRVSAELEEWHRKHEFDLARLLEEKPKLFQALIAEPKMFNGSAIGEKYCRVVNSTVAKAERSGYYKEAFISPRKDLNSKDKLSIGRLVSTTRRRKSPKR